MLATSSQCQDSVSSCRDATLDARASSHHLIREHARFQLRRRPWPFLATGLLACAIGLGAESPVTSIEHRASNIEFQPAYFRTGVLTMEDRIWAQTQIERVYYNHRIWPKENPGPKPPFETMVPAELIAKKAAEPLLMSAALKQYWNVEITPIMLQTEMDRMERESRDRSTLHELFVALRNDPFLIAETMALDNLAKKALRNHYAFDVNLHANERQLAESISAQVKNGADWSELNASYSHHHMERESDGANGQRAAPARALNDVIKLSPVDWTALRERLTNLDAGIFREEETGYLFERKISENSRDLETESLFIPKRSFDDWWAHTIRLLLIKELPFVNEIDAFILPAPGLITAGGCDVWDGGNNLNASPAKRDFHTAIWTGSEMIVWGGYNGIYMNSGGRYNPATDSWLPTSMGTNVPAGRYYHTTVWTGSVMIVWGGYDGIVTYFNTGGRYNPATDSWLPTSTGTNNPVGRYLHTAVWTGTVMIVWGGWSGADLNTGGRYDPPTDSWLSTSSGANVPVSRHAHTAVWTGSVMIVWGGYGGAYLNTGGRYNPAANSWLSTWSGFSVPDGRDYHAAVWTGSVMIVWGGYFYNGFDNYINTGGRYNPATDSWMPTSISTNSPVGRYVHTAVWTGSEMIVWGGLDGVSYVNSGGRYNPATDSWLPTPAALNVPARRYAHTAVWTGSEMIVWGGRGNTYQNSGGRYNPATDSWLPTLSIGANVPDGRYDHTAVWTGGEMIVWGGTNGPYLNSGGRYNLATDSWLPTSIGANVPAARQGHTAVWTGSEMIVWGGTNSVDLNSGGRYNPVADGWVPTSIGANVPTGSSEHSAVWTGSVMIVWGGTNFAYLNSGGRYNPATDSWLTTSTGANVPAARQSHTAVWTGSEMIVWGGWSGAYLDTGGRYNPATDTWITTAVSVNAPAARQFHTAIWTGSEMIVWGGYGNTGDLNSGGRYNPATNGWVPTSIGANVPAGRDSQTTVWTGNEMIVWGGRSPYLNSGGRYRPASDSWLTTATIDPNIPIGRYDHTAVWAGSVMIVWGGYNGSFLDTGGIYSMLPPATVGTSLRGGKSATVNLSWTAANGAASYNVKRCNTACIPITIVATPTTNSYSEAMDAISYFYAVEAVNACGVTP